jgi:hypothetical protein
VAWVLRRARADGGGYVALPGSRKAYTRNKLAARRFDSREAADADACGNETPESLYDEGN